MGNQATHDSGGQARVRPVRGEFNGVGTLGHVGLQPRLQNRHGVWAQARRNLPLISGQLV